MNDVVLTGIALTTAATSLLLVAEHRGSLVGRAVTKPLASTGFLIAAIGFNALETSHGRWLLAGLALSFLGDVLLIATAEAAFLGGLGSFLLGHLAFAFAFWTRGVQVTSTAAASLLVLIVGVGTWRWLSPHVGAAMRAPVIAYLLVISAMVALAVGTFASEPRLPILVGALGFAVSDVSVARDRFVAPGLANKLWGLPLYFGSQLLIASAAS